MLRGAWPFFYSEYCPSSLGQNSKQERHCLAWTEYSLIAFGGLSVVENSSYEAIARKWRPQRFDEIVGQSHVSQTLQNALVNHRLHHAILLTGPRGTGKTTTARVLAKSLRCSQAQNFVPCNQCEECLDISLGRSVNVLEIDGASNNGVDAIRELRETVGYMPASGRYKIYIIDEVHMLSTSAFNALLKTLEEPPPHVIFIMATTEVHKIPNTILSRVQRYDFRRISSQAIVAHLEKICREENVQFEDKALWAIAKAGEGSMRDSQSLLDQMITFSNHHLTLERVTDVLGLTDRELLIEVLRAFVAQDVHLTLLALGKISSQGQDPKIFLHSLLEEIRHLLLLKIVGPNEDALVDVSSGEKQELCEIAEKFSAEDIHLLFDMCLKGTGDLGRAQDQRTVFEMILLRMTQAPRIQNLHLLFSQLGQSKPLPSKSKGTTPLPQKSQEGSLDSGPKVSASPSPSPTALTEDVGQPLNPHGNLTEQWHELVKKINRVNPLMGATLENVVLCKMTDNCLFLTVGEKKKFVYDKMTESSFKKKLMNYLASFLGHNMDYAIEVEETSGAQLSPRELAQKQEEKRQEDLRRTIEEHPLIKETQALFGAEIKAIKEIKS